MKIDNGSLLAQLIWNNIGHVSHEMRAHSEQFHKEKPAQVGLHLFLNSDQKNNLGSRKMKFKLYSRLRAGYYLFIFG